jgi:hypothetical protein
MKRDFNKIVLLTVFVVGVFTSCKDEPYIEQYIALNDANFSMSYDPTPVTVNYDVTKDTLAVTVAKPTNFKVPIGLVYSIVVDTIMGDSTAYITKNYKTLAALLVPRGAYSPYPILYPKDAFNGTVRIDYNNLRSYSLMSEKNKAKVIFFRKGKYQIYMKVLTPNGAVRMRNNPINLVVDFM